MLIKRIAKILRGDSLKKHILFKETPLRSNVAIYSDLFIIILKYRELDANYWIYDFPHKTRKQQKEYLYYPEFRKLRNQMNLSNELHFSGKEQYNHLALLRDKLVFGQYVSSLGFPIPKNLFFYHNNKLYDLANGRKITFNSILNENKDTFCKLVYGECGKGVFHVVINENKLFIDGEKKNTNSFFEQLGDASFVFQETIKQHPVLSSLYSMSVNTMRTITIVDKLGQVKHLDSILRVGAGGNNVDNWFAGGLVIGINPDGTLKRIGLHEYKINGKISHISHPDTKAVFEGTKIPFFFEAIETVCRLHSFMPGIGAIGWDIAITPNGPCIIEGNDNFEISLNQAVNGGLKQKWIELTH